MSSKLSIKNILKKLLEKCYRSVSLKVVYPGLPKNLVPWIWEILKKRKYLEILTIFTCLTKKLKLYVKNLSHTNIFLYYFKFFFFIYTPLSTFLYLGNISERFSKKKSEEVNQVFGSVLLRTILYTDRPLSGIYKDVFPSKNKVTLSINLFVTVLVTTWEKTFQRFHVTIDQHVPKIFKSWFDGNSEIPAEKYFSVIGQHLLDNHECARNY